MKDTEIEIKVRVSDSSRLLAFLHDKAKFVGEFHQVDDYFNAPHRDFAAVRPIEEWLRVRQSSNKAAITYKRWHYDDGGRSVYADEFETTLGDAQTMRKIFQALNFAPVVTVDKTRRIWHYADYEISVDRVKNLGDFVEIEYKGKTAVKPKTVTDGMVKFLHDIGCGTIERSHQGYAWMTLAPSETVLEKV